MSEKELLAAVYAYTSNAIDRVETKIDVITELFGVVVDISIEKDPSLYELYKEAALNRLLERIEIAKEDEDFDTDSIPDLEELKRETSQLFWSICSCKKVKDEQREVEEAMDNVIPFPGGSN